MEEERRKLLIGGMTHEDIQRHNAFYSTHRDWNIMIIVVGSANLVGLGGLLLPRVILSPRPRSPLGDRSLPAILGDRSLL